MITVGSLVGDEEYAGSVVVAVHGQEGSSGPEEGAELFVVLAYAPRCRMWCVWDGFPDGRVENGRFISDGVSARYVYVERVAKRLFSLYNHRAPGLSWEVQNFEHL